MSNKINNPSARFWTRTQLKQTVKEAKTAGLQVHQEQDMTTITDPGNQDRLVLRSLNNGRNEMVRLDKSYFA
jgi:hypothetical protein